jgi:hypothetical protein
MAVAINQLQFLNHFEELDLTNGQRRRADAKHARDLSSGAEAKRVKSWIAEVSGID